MGERWTLLILREAFLGTRRFDEFQANLGIARNVLQSGSSGWSRRACSARALPGAPERFEYKLTRKGVDLWPVLVSLMKWGDKYTAENGRPIVFATSAAAARSTTAASAPPAARR